MNNFDNFNEENENKQGGSNLLVKATFGLFGLVILIIFILLIMKGCSVTKNNEQNSTQKNSEVVTLVEDDKSTEKETEKVEGGENSSELDKNSSANTESSESMEGKISSTEKLETTAQNSEVDGVVMNENIKSIYEVDELELGSINEKQVMVSNKKIYRTEGFSYAYCIGLVFPSKDGYVIVEYFCPKKTYDAVNMGDTVSVKFQLDENGIVAITSISK